MILLQHWSAPPVPLALGLVALLAFERGSRSLAARGSRRSGQSAQAWWFRSGVVLAVLVVASPLGWWAGRELSALTLQDCVETFVAAVMIALGGPWDEIAAGLSPAQGTARFARLRRNGWWQAAGSPIVAVVAVLLPFLVWHVPAVADATVSSPFLHGLELATSLVGGLMFWVQLVGSHPFSPRLDHLARVSVIGAVLVGVWVPGTILVFESSVWYTAYAHLAGTWLPAVDDENLAGGVIWVLPVLMLGMVGFWTMTSWLNREEDDDWRLHRVIEQTRARMGVTTEPIGGSESA